MKTLRFVFPLVMIGLIAGCSTLYYGAMKRAEATLEPVLIPLRDQVLFMKHNLNARAIAGLSGEVSTIQANVDTLVRDMESAIAQADSFIASLENE